ncbi:hypothetical protein BJ912DRAFT_911052, partial [Pholiota molesta]
MSLRPIVSYVYITVTTCALDPRNASNTCHFLTISNTMDINIPTALFSVFACLLVVVLLQKLASNLDDVPPVQGPKSQSWLF